MRSRAWVVLLFVVASLIAGFVFWRRAYVDRVEFGQEPMPKFKLTPAEQFVGMFLGGAVTWTAVAVCKTWCRLKGATR